jgi:F0F1-type ATP synthase membrane subunit b/b'
MTATDLTERIAGMQAQLAHIERQLSDAARARDKVADQHAEMLQRVTRLEAQASSSSDLPPRMAHVETANAVQDAMRADRDEMRRDMRRLGFGIVAAVGTLISIAVTVIAWIQ